MEDEDDEGQKERKRDRDINILAKAQRRQREREWERERERQRVVYDIPYIFENVYVENTHEYIAFHNLEFLNTIMKSVTTTSF